MKLRNILIGLVVLLLGVVVHAQDSSDSLEAAHCKNSINGRAPPQMGGTPLEEIHEEVRLGKLWRRLGRLRRRVGLSLLWGLVEPPGGSPMIYIAVTDFIFRNVLQGSNRSRGFVFEHFTIF